MLSMISGTQGFIYDTNPNKASIFSGKSMKNRHTIRLLPQGWDFCPNWSWKLSCFPDLQGSLSPSCFGMLLQMFHPIKHWSSWWTGQPPCHFSPTRWPFPYVDGEICLEFQLLGGSRSRLRPPKETNHQIATAPIAVGLYYSQPKKRSLIFYFLRICFFFLCDLFICSFQNVWVCVGVFQNQVP